MFSFSIQLLCIIVENESDIDAFKNYVPTAEDNQTLGAKSSTPTPTPTQQTTSSQQIPIQQQTTISSPKVPTPQKSHGQRIFASPLARSLAAAKGIDLSQLSGSGPNGRIISNDLQNVQSSLLGSNVTSSSSNYQDLDTSMIRQTIAKRLSIAKQTIPHYYLTVEIDVNELIKIREQMNKMLSKENVKLSINDFIIKAAALACKKGNLFFIRIF